ncbi:hypothetical protein ANO14919_034230 [Xylariales sp. No.14919]|nr:hypothetical protein ANO14919_034230 [Xylariales sp. No.14919]
MATNLTALLGLTTLVSTTAAISLWVSRDEHPSDVPTLTVHIFLFAVIAPLLLRLVRAHVRISQIFQYYRLSSMYLTMAIFVVLGSFYSIGYIVVSSLIHPKSERPKFTDVARHLWYNGLSMKQTISSFYALLFRLIFDSKLFWNFFIPLFIIQSIFDWSVYIYSDYFILFKDLGVGGSGTTFRGWMLARLRAFAANVDVFRPPRVPQTAQPYRGRLNILPQRQGPRPSILGVTPQRQVDFPVPPNTQALLEELFAEFVHIPESEADIDHITIRESYLEPGLQALRRRLTVPMNENGGPLNAAAAFNTADMFGGEICHFHHEGTTHIVLHPEDCRRVIESGWGERHPFCTNSWYWRLYFNWYLGIRLPVPEGLMMLYAPRHQGDIEIIRELMRAAVWFVTDGRLHSIDANTYPMPPAP